MRFLAEMNQTNNGYSAYNRDGSSRGKSHSTKAFNAAWRRATLILRGGPVADIDAKLATLHLPPLDTNATALPVPQVAMAWVPQTEGTPNIHKNRARAYWPGRQYVDWVGTDFYSKFPNFTGPQDASTTTSRASRSCSASGRCGAPTARASCTSSSSS